MKKKETMQLMIEEVDYKKRPAQYIAEALDSISEIKIWRRYDDPPEHGNEVLIITNYGDVFQLRFLRGECEDE